MKKTSKKVTKKTTKKKVAKRKPTLSEAETATLFKIVVSSGLNDLVGNILRAEKECKVFATHEFTAKLEDGRTMSFSIKD